MKKTLIHIGLGAALALTATSCKKGWLEGVNDNPNEVTSVTPDLLLPSIEAHLAYGIGGDMSRFTTVLTQQATGAARQFATYQIYDITETETDNLWKFNLYGGALMDLNDLINSSKTAGNKYYQAVGNVLMAWGLMTTTDAFGDIPYSEAFKGGDNLQPKFDTQERIYESIFSLLTEAKTLLADTEGGDLQPGSDDLLYGGDTDAWTKLANVLAARAHLHLGKVSSSHYQMALDALGTEGVNSFGSNADDAIYHYGVGETEASTWYQFNDQRGDISFSGALLDQMIATADPRLDAFVDTTGGGDAMGAFYGSADAPFDFVTYAEQKFIEAEAAFRTGDLVRAASAHNAAVAASLARIGVSDAAFTAAYGSETDVTLTLEKIMNQKYVAMFTNPEAFTDWRRTGFPALSAVAGNVTGGVIPRRLPMAQSERLFNPSAPAPAAITVPVWWDQ